MTQQNMELVKQVAAAIETRNTDAISLAHRIVSMVQDPDVSEGPYTQEQRIYASEQATDPVAGEKVPPQAAYGQAPVPTDTQVEKHKEQVAKREQAAANVLDEKVDKCRKKNETK